MQWLQTDGSAEEMVTAVNYQSGVCLRDDASQQAQMGGILFRSPSLFNGQAAKARLTCHSCHVDGGDNPYFHFPSISGAPGTADVSNSFLSAAGSNGAFDPVPIPDLSKRGKVSRADPMVLETFLETLIVNEFAGASPSKAVLKSLAAFTRELTTCDAVESSRPKGLDKHIVIARNAMRFAKELYDNGDHKTAAIMIATARDTYGLIHERFANEEHRKLRKDLEKLGARLGALQLPIKADEWHRTYAELSEASLILDQSLRKSEPRSFYEAEVLRSALQ